MHNNEDLWNFSIPNYDNLPDMDLFCEQVLHYINDLLRPINLSNNRLTRAMINNYVQMGLITPTTKKRYTKDHIAYLIIVTLLKQIYPIAKIENMIYIQEENYTIEETFNYFIVELEHAIADCFFHQHYEDSDKSNIKERLYIRASVIAYANLLLVHNFLTIKIPQD